MYPQVLLLGVAWWKQDSGVKKYSIPLAILGIVFAAYHYLTQRFPSIVSTCGVGEADCSYTYGFDYGYITIPIMALTIFIAIVFFVSIWKKDTPDQE